MPAGGANGSAARFQAAAKLSSRVTSSIRTASISGSGQRPSVGPRHYCTAAAGLLAMSSRGSSKSSSDKVSSSSSTAGVTLLLADTG